MNLFWIVWVLNLHCIVWVAVQLTIVSSIDFDSMSFSSDISLLMVGFGATSTHIILFLEILFWSKPSSSMLKSDGSEVILLLILMMVLVCTNSCSIVPDYVLIWCWINIMLGALKMILNHLKHKYFINKNLSHTN